MDAEKHAGVPAAMFFLSAVIDGVRHIRRHRLQDSFQILLMPEAGIQSERRSAHKPLSSYFLLDLDKTWKLLSVRKK